MKARGFTLIELMIVVAIIGILAAIVLPAYQRWANGGASPTPSTSGETVHRVDMNSPRCVNGVLLQNNEPVVKDGAAVRC